MQNNIAHTFTSNEKKIIKQFSSQIVKSLTRLGDKGHPEFELTKEEYMVDDMDVKCGVVDCIIKYEDVANEPGNIIGLNDIELMVAKLVILTTLPKDKLPNAKKNLLKKIDHILKLKTLNSN